MSVNVWERIERLSPAQRNAFQQALNRSLQEAQGVPPPQKHERGAVAPLSFAQERLWFLEQLGTLGTAYELPLTLHLQEQLDMRALEKSFAELIKRHEILRTRFEVHDGQGMQVIDPPGEWRLTVEDCEGCSVAELERRVQEHALGGFDLRNGPLLRVRLLRRSDQQHVLLVRMHHIVSDGWSQEILARELNALYRGFAGGRPVCLPELPLQYADYALWQRQWLQGELLQKQLQYWREQLSGAPQALELPTDRPRPPVASHEGAVCAFTLPAKLSGQLKEFARAQGATLYMVLLGAFQVLLSRYSGQRDVVVGCPIAGRTYAQLEGLIGFFVNTLPLRLKLEGRASFAEVMDQVRQQTLGAYAHQDIPFERLVAELQPRRDLSRQPVFQAMFALHNQPRAASYLQETGWVTRQSATYTSHGESREPYAAGVSSKFDLTLNLRDGPEGITGGLQYATALFDAGTIQAMTRSYECLLRELALNPTKSVFDCRLMSRSEERRQLRQGRGRSREYPTSGIHEQFESQVQRTPNSLAVVYENLSLTYGQLNEVTGRLGRHLRATGVGAGIRVGIHLERSLEQLIAVLGVMKAGGTYVPLEVGLPDERLAYLIEDAQIKHVLLLEESTRSLPSSGIEVVLMDGAATQEGWLRKYADETPAAVSEATLPRPTEPEALYILYTSGSTGKPKGVVVGHREVSNYLAYAGRAYLGPEIEVAVVSTPLSFDATLTTLLAPLLIGKTVRLLSHQTGYLEELSRELFESEKPRLFKLTPAHLQALSHAAEASPTRAVPHRIVVGGEQLSVTTLEPWIRSLPLARFVNEYGPTETVVGCCVYELSGAKGLEELGGATVVPIGRAIANTQLYVLGENRRLQPLGSIGELYIAGAGVTRGYLNRADLTNERFVEDRYVRGRRLYRSGDRVRWRSQGQGVLEFVGRADDQVKLRGHRIELGEIEATLQSHPEVRQAAVVLHEAPGGVRQLIGYVVSEKEGAPSAAQLRDYLERTLPSYMVPGQYLQLGQLPLTGNGKVDRMALPAPDRPGAPREPAAAFTPTEAALERVWRKVLRVEGMVGVHDNFFERGGDSILAISLMAQAAKAGLKLTIQQIFESPTIAELAVLLTGAQAGDAEQGNAHVEVALTPNQRCFFEANIPDAHHYNQSVLLESGEAVQVTALRGALAGLLEHHDALRLSFRRTPQGWVQQQRRFDGQEAVPLERIDLSQVEERRREEEFHVHAQRLQESLDLQAGPLLRAGLFVYEPGHPQQLLLIVHRLVVDGESWRILLEDLHTAYEQQQRGQTVRLGPKSHSFVSWSEQVSRYAQSAELQAQSEYWRKQEAADTDEEDLPVDHAGGRNTVGTAEQVGVRLDMELTRALLHEAPGVDDTRIDDVLLTALAQCLGEWRGGDVARLYLENDGRGGLVDPLSVSRTIGWFTSVFPVRLSLRGCTGWGERLQQVKKQLREIPHRGMGYAVLRYRGDPVSGGERQSRESAASFEYLGRLEQENSRKIVFRLSARAHGADRSPRQTRSCQLSVTSHIAEGLLYVAWTYSRELHERSTIEALAQRYVQCLRELIGHCP